MSGGGESGDSLPVAGTVPASGVTGEPAPAAPAPAQGAPIPSGEVTNRLVFIDVMRTIAVGRIVVNHALPWPWMKWFEALPVMFFASGALVGRSLQTRDAWTVFKGRFRRLALPFAVYWFASFVMTVTKVLPDTDTHLWYVWNFLAFTALSGLFLKALRKAPWVLVAVMAAVVVVWTLLGAQESALGAAYGLAWVLGMWWADKGCPIPPAPLLLVGIVAGFAISIVTVQQMLGIDATVSPSAIGVAMACLGLAWLSIGMLLRNQLEALTRVRGVGPFIRWLNKRLLTVYLWHLPATLLARQWADSLDLGGALWVLFVLAVTLTLTGIATLVFGGLEDRASASSAKVKAAAATTAIDLR